MPDPLDPTTSITWVHDFDRPKYRQVLEDPEVLTQINAIHDRLQHIFFDAGFRVGRMKPSVTVSHLDATSKKDIELLDINQGARLVITHTLKADYKGGVKAGLTLRSSGGGDLDPENWPVLITLERDAYQLNWQVAQENFTGRFRRDDIVVQLRDQQFFDVEAALPLDWVQQALDVLEP